MEIKRLNVEHYDEAFNLLNTVFANKYGREMDFKNELPKMWVRDDEHMQKHFGIFEDGKLVSISGIYPLKVKIGDETLLFATTGNIATLPEYEGRGYFSATFTRVMEEINNLGVDVARLGGARQRYANWGYEPAGQSYNFVFNKENRIKYYKNAGADIEFKLIKRDDIESLKFVNELSKTSKIYIERSIEDNYRDVYLSLCTKHALPYLAIRNGLPIGYLSAVVNGIFVGADEWGENILEIRAIDTETFITMVCAWQRIVDKDINFNVSSHMPEELKRFSASAEYMIVTSPSRFKVINYQKLINALMQIKNPSTMLNGEEIIEIKDYGTIRIFKNNDVCGCELCEAKANIVLDKLTATRTLFGHMPPLEIADKSLVLTSWLPLPLSWDTLDYV